MVQNVSYLHFVLSSEECFPNNTASDIQVEMTMHNTSQSLFEVRCWEERDNICKLSENHYVAGNNTIEKIQ